MQQPQKEDIWSNVFGGIQDTDISKVSHRLLLI